MATSKTTERRKSVGTAYYSFQDLKELFQLGRPTVERLIDQPDFPKEFVFGRVRCNDRPTKRLWLRSQVEAWIEAQAMGNGAAEHTTQGHSLGNGAPGARQQAPVC